MMQRTPLRRFVRALRASGALLAPALAIGPGVVVAQDAPPTPDSTDDGAVEAARLDELPELPGPDAARAAFDLARTLERANDALDRDLPERAYDLFREIAARREDLPAAHFNAGIAAWRAGDGDGALESFAHAARAGDPAITALALDARATIELRAAVERLRAAATPAEPGAAAPAQPIDPATAIAPLERSLAASRDLLALGGASLDARRRAEIAATLLDLLRRQQEQEQQQQDQQQQDDQQQDRQDGEGDDSDSRSEDAQESGEGDEQDRQDGEQQDGEQQDGQQQDGQQQDGQQQDGQQQDGQQQDGQQQDGEQQDGDARRPVDDPSAGGDPTRDPSSDRDERADDRGDGEPEDADRDANDAREDDPREGEESGDEPGDERERPTARAGDPSGSEGTAPATAAEGTPVRMSRAQAEALLQRIRDRDLARRAYLRALRAEREARDRRRGAPGGRDW